MRWATCLRAANRSVDAGGRYRSGERQQLCGLRRRLARSPARWADHQWQRSQLGAAVGVWPAYTDVHSYNVASGSFITDADVSGDASVVVLGATVAQTLFGNTDPAGQTVRLSGTSFKVVGVMEAKGGSGFGSVDGQVYIPITTAMAKLTGGGVAVCGTSTAGRQ